MTTLVLVAAVVLGADGVSIASPGLAAVNLPEKEAQFFSEHFAQQLALLGPKVITQAEVQQLLGLDQQRQLLGCGEDSSCAAEIGNALGVDALISGNLGKFGDDVAVNLKILSAKDGAQLAVYSSTVKGTNALLPELKRAARKMLPDVYSKLGRTMPELPPEEEAPQVVVMQDPRPTPKRVVPTSAYVFAGSAVALAAVGAVLRVDASGRANRIRNADDDVDFVEASTEVESIKLENTLMIAAFAASGACLAISGWRFFSAPVEATAYVAPGGGGVAIGGTF